MLLISKIKSKALAVKAKVKSKAVSVAQKTKKSAIRFADWFCRGRIISTMAYAKRVMGDTFAKATHGGAVSSGLVRNCNKALVSYISDIDGEDLATDVKAYIADLKKRYPDNSPPVKLFTASGVLGMYARTELCFVMIYGGVPYILPVHVEFEGIDENDAKFEDGANRVIKLLSTQGCNNVVSLGFVSKQVNVNEFVLDYAKHSPLFNTTEIDHNLVSMSIQSGTISSLGSLYLPGGYLYDIYVLDRLMSKTLRPYRDFTKEEDPFPEGNEVILVGGDPDIVRVGSQATQTGFMFDVWIPNDARYYNTAVATVAEQRLPLANVEVDDDEFLESYAYLLKMLRELDEEVHGPAPDDTVPDMIVNPDEDGDTEEVPVLIDLPEYLL